MAGRVLAGRRTAAVRTGNPARRFKAATYRENVRGCGRSVAERGPQESARRVTRRRGVDRSRRGLVRRGTRRVGPSAQAGGGRGRGILTETFSAPRTPWASRTA